MFFFFFHLLRHVLKSLEDTKKAQVRSKNPNASSMVEKSKVVTH